jgi:signal transduction histidine kinase
MVGGIGFFVLTLLCSFLLGARTVPANHVTAPLRDGALDLTGVDLGRDVVGLPPESFTHYPEQLLAPGEAGGATGDWASPYGTARVRVRLPAGEPLALSATAPDHALRVWAGGQEVGAWGTVGATAKDSRARAGNLIAGLVAEAPVTDLTIWHSGFVRHYGLPAVYVGSAANLAAQQERLVLRDSLFAGGALAAALLFLGMFSFFGRKAPYALFALCCGCLGVYNLVTGSLPLALLAPAGAAPVARLEYLALFGFASGFILYLCATFPGLVARWARRAGVALFALIGLSLLALPPWQFTRLLWVYVAAEAVAGVFVIATLVARARRPSVEQRLVLLAAGLLVAVALLEQTLLRWALPHWYATGLLTSTAMAGMVVLNMIALAIHAMRAERDLERSRRAEQAMRDANRSLQRLGELQRGFLRTMSHELRTPLAVMGGHAQLSAQKLRLGIDKDDIVRRMGVISRESIRLGELVNSLLERDHPVDERAGGGCLPVPVARHCAQLYEPLVARNGNRLRLALPGRLPVAAISEQGLTQVLLNLLANSARHTRQGVVELGARLEGARVALWVRDTGEGMPEALLAEMVQPGAAGERAGESGLGLPLSREIVEAVGGILRLDSHVGEGTLVEIRVPLADTDGDDGGDSRDDGLGGGVGGIDHSETGRSGGADGDHLAG